MACQIRKCAECPSHNKSSFCGLAAEDTLLLDCHRAEVEVAVGAPATFKHLGESGFYCVRDGYLKLSRINLGEKRTVRICGPGDLVGFGKQAAIESGALVAESILQPAQLCFFSYASIDNLLTTRPQIAAGVLTAVCKLLNEAEINISGLARHCLKGRVASVLFLLNQKFGIPSEQGSKIQIVLDRKTLSEISGTITVSMARVLTDFENEKIILRKGRAIHVLNSEALQKYATS